MLASNYTALGQKRMGRYALLGSVLVVLAVLLVGLVLPVLLPLVVSLGLEFSGRQSKPV